VNPLSYQVNALRGLLIGTSAAIALGFGVVILALIIGIVASSLLGRLARAG
jgi:ABC-2 type transport system permease protein